MQLKRPYVWTLRVGMVSSFYLLLGPPSWASESPYFFGLFKSTPKSALLTPSPSISSPPQASSSALPKTPTQSSAKSASKSPAQATHPSKPDHYNRLGLDEKISVYKYLDVKDRATLQKTSKKENGINSIFTKSSQNKLREFENSLHSGKTLKRASFTKNLLDEAVLQKRLDILEAAREVKNDYYPTEHNHAIATAMINAAKTKNMKLLEEFYAHPRLRTQLPFILVQAAVDADPATWEVLTGLGAASARDAQGRNALHLLSTIPVEENRPLEAVIQRLREAGVSIEAKDFNGRTPLSVACGLSDPIPVYKLLAAGANPNVKDPQGRTPLHWAVIEKRRHYINPLLKAGAQLNATDQSGRTPLDYAKEMKFDVIEKKLREALELKKSRRAEKGQGQVLAPQIYRGGALMEESDD